MEIILAIASDTNAIKVPAQMGHTAQQCFCDPSIGAGSEPFGHQELACHGRMVI